MALAKEQQYISADFGDIALYLRGIDSASERATAIEARMDSLIPILDRMAPKLQEAIERQDLSQISNLLHDAHTILLENTVASWVLGADSVSEHYDNSYRPFAHSLEIKQAEHQQRIHKALKPLVNVKPETKAEWLEKHTLLRDVEEVLEAAFLRYKVSIPYRNPHYEGMLADPKLSPQSKEDIMSDALLHRFEYDIARCKAGQTVVDYSCKAYKRPQDLVETVLDMETEIHGLQKYWASALRGAMPQDVKIQDVPYISLRRRMSAMEPSFSFDQAREIVIAAAADFHPALGETVKRAFDEGWVVRGNPSFMGMSGMAIAVSRHLSKNSHPYVYIPKKDRYSFKEVGGLIAHELGHAAAQYFDARADNGYGTHSAFSEIFSILMEQHTGEYMTRHASTPLEKLVLEDYYTKHTLESFGAPAGTSIAEHKLRAQHTPEHPLSGHEITNIMAGPLADQVADDQRYRDYFIKYWTQNAYRMIVRTPYDDIAYPLAGIAVGAIRAKMQAAATPKERHELADKWLHVMDDQGELDYRSALKRLDIDMTPQLFRQTFADLRENAAKFERRLGSITTDELVELTGSPQARGWVMVVQDNAAKKTATNQR